MCKLRSSDRSSGMGTLLKSGSDFLPSASFHHCALGGGGGDDDDTEEPCLRTRNFLRTAGCHQDALLVGYTAQTCAPDSPSPQRPHSLASGASSPPGERPCLSLPCPVASLSGSLGRSPNRIGQLRYVWWLKAGGREASGEDGVRAAPPPNAALPHKSTTLGFLAPGSIPGKGNQRKPRNEPLGS